MANDPHPYRVPRRDYTSPALLTMILYFVFWFPGLIANAVYLGSARKERAQTGIAPNGVGCLWALLVTFVGLPMLFFLLWLFELGRQ